MAHWITPSGPVETLRIFSEQGFDLQAVGNSGGRKLGKESTVGISLSLLLAAGGAILIWAVNTTSSGFNIHTAGVILLVVGIIGFVLSLAFWSSWGGFGGYSRRDTDGNNTTVVR
jgi:hypothetical protein